MAPLPCCYLRSASSLPPMPLLLESSAIRVLSYSHKQASNPPADLVHLNVRFLNLGHVRGSLQSSSMPSVQASPVIIELILARSTIQTLATKLLLHIFGGCHLEKTCRFCNYYPWPFSAPCCHTGSDSWLLYLILISLWRLLFFGSIWPFFCWKTPQRWLLSFHDNNMLLTA